MTKDKPVELADAAVEAATGGIKAEGSFFLPEVDDEVIVGFLDSDPRNPVVVGGLWNGTDSASTSSVGGSQTATIGTNSTDTTGGKGH